MSANVFTADEDDAIWEFIKETSVDWNTPEFWDSFRTKTGSTKSDHSLNSRLIITLGPQLTWKTDLDANMKKHLSAKYGIELPATGPARATRKRSKTATFSVLELPKRSKRSVRNPEIAILISNQNPDDTNADVTLTAVTEDPNRPTTSSALPEDEPDVEEPEDVIFEQPKTDSEFSKNPEPEVPDVTAPKALLITENQLKDFSQSITDQVKTINEALVHRTLHEIRQIHGIAEETDPLKASVLKLFDGMEAVVGVIGNGSTRLAEQLAVVKERVLNDGVSEETLGQVINVALRMF